LLAACHGEAFGQSFQATATIASGTATVSTSGNATSIVVGTPSSIIDWTPVDGASGPSTINFQTADTTATYVNDPAVVGEYAVLNRILPMDPSRAIAFNGTILARLRSASGALTRGGSVFFYSPGGIVVGGSAVIDVGRLGLTTAPMDIDTAGTFLTDAGLARFGVANSTSQIQIASGARLTANDFIAVVSPTIRNAGAINGGKAVAMVAADAATITFSPSGLFDIEVTAGSSGTGSVLSNSGSITGAISPAANEAHRIYLVAMPRNQAMTLAITSGSTLGFDIAGAANLEGNAVVLSAGHDIVAGNAAASRSGGGGTGTVDVTLGVMTATSTLDIAATGNVALSSPGTPSRFHGNLAIRSDGSINALGTLTSVGHGSATTILLDAAGDVSLDTVNAAVDLSVTAAHFQSVGPIVAAGDITLATLSSVHATTLTAGDDVTVRSGSDVTVDALRTTGVGPDDALFDISGPPDRANVAIESSGVVTLGTVAAKAILAIRGADIIGNSWTAGEDIAIVSGSSVQVGTLTAADDINIAAAGAVSLNSATTTGLGPDDRRVQFRQVLTLAAVSGDRANIVMEAAGPLSIDTASSRASLVARANQIQGNEWTAGEDIALRSAGSTSIGQLTAADDIDVASALDIRIGVLTTTGSGPDDRLIVLEAGASPSFLSGANNRANVTLDAQGVVDAQTADIRASLAVRGARVQGSVWRAGEDIAVSSLGSVTLGTVTAGDDVAIAGNGPLSVGDVTASGTGDDNRTVLIAPSARIALQDSRADTANVTLISNAGASGADLTAGRISAAGSVVLDAGSKLAASAIDAGDSIMVRAGSDVALDGALAAAGALDVRAVGAIAAGNLSTPGQAAVLAGRGITAGPVSGRNVVVLAGGDVQLAGLSAGAARGSGTAAAVPSGQIVIAGIGSTPLATVTQLPTPVSPLNAELTRLAGSVTISGPVVSIRFSTYAQGVLRTGTINASEAIVVKTGPLAIAQKWTSPSITIGAMDLDIAAAGTGPLLDAGASGSITVASTNPDGVLLGDGLAGTGFALGNAELGRIAAASLTINGLDIAGAGADVLIGSLALARPQFGALQQVQNWNLAIGVHDSQGQISGLAKIVGDVHITGALTADRVAISSGRFQLDITAGALVVESGTGQLGGELAISADDIGIADSVLLEKLAGQPLGAQLAAELNAPAAVQRPSGVLAAQRITLAPGRTLLVQNTGSALRPAGILAGSGLIAVSLPSSPPQSGVAVVVNGQYGADTGLAGQSLAYNVFVSALGNGGGISPESQFNSCLILAGACGTDRQDNPAPASQLTALLSPRLDTMPQFVANEIDQGEVVEAGAGVQAAAQGAQASAGDLEEQAANPIPAPPLLIDTRPIVKSDDSFAPTLGGGNPGVTDIPLAGRSGE
jgi:filamentous hemagglutinin family protein